jgi:hypothetical protein
MVGKSMTLTLATLALPAFVSAAGRVPAPRGPRVPAPLPRAECLAVQLTSPQGPAVRGAFSAQRHYDVDFAVKLAPRAATPGRVVQLKLYTPRGFLYQTLETAVPQAQPRPRQRRPATPKDTTLAARLPVAGTWITQNTLYGSWKVVPYFEGQTAACGRAATFQITR